MEKQEIARHKKFCSGNESNPLSMCLEAELYGVCVLGVEKGAKTEHSLGR